MRQNRNSRCSRDRQKDIHLTEGALHFYELETEKSAEVIVAVGNELMNKSDSLTSSEGLGVPD